MDFHGLCGVLWMSMEHPWTLCPWTFHGLVDFSAKSPWTFGKIVNFLWTLRGLFVEFLWTFCGLNFAFCSRSHQKKKVHSKSTESPQKSMEMRKVHGVHGVHME